MWYWAGCWPGLPPWPHSPVCHRVHVSQFLCPLCCWLGFWLGPVSLPFWSLYSPFRTQLTSQGRWLTSPCSWAPVIQVSNHFSGTLSPAAPKPVPPPEASSGKGLSPPLSHPRCWPLGSFQLHLTPCHLLHLPTTGPGQAGWKPPWSLQPGWAFSAPLFCLLPHQPVTSVCHLSFHVTYLECPRHCVCCRGSRSSGRGRRERGLDEVLLAGPWCIVTDGGCLPPEGKLRVRTNQQGQAWGLNVRNIESELKSESEIARS